MGVLPPTGSASADDRLPGCRGEALTCEPREQSLGVLGLSAEGVKPQNTSLPCTPLCDRLIPIGAGNEWWWCAVRNVLGLMLIR